MSSALVPLLCALVYVLGTLVVKRALERGADLWGALALNYWVMALVFLPVMLLPGGPQPWDRWWQPVVVGVFSFLGQLFAFKAITSGDLTIATPAMGSKVVMVALFTEVVLGLHVPAAWWIAAVLSFLALIFLQYGQAASRRNVLLTLSYSLLAATSFALGDVFIQRWAGDWGVFRFVPAFAAVTAILSLGLLPFARRPRLRYSAGAWAWLVPGVILLSLQSLGLTLVIGLEGDATLVNIMFSSRGLWNFLLIWYGGHLFGNREREAGPRVMAMRLLGAALMFGAILLASTAM